MLFSEKKQQPDLVLKSNTKSPVKIYNYIIEKTNSSTTILLNNTTKAEDTSENYLFQLNKSILFVHIVYDDKSKSCQKCLSILSNYQKTFSMTVETFFKTVSCIVTVAAQTFYIVRVCSKPTQ